MGTIEAKHLFGNLALRHAFVYQFDGIGHHGVVGGRGDAHKLAFLFILKSAGCSYGVASQEKLAGSMTLNEGH